MVMTNGNYDNFKRGVVLSQFNLFNVMEIYSIHVQFCIISICSKKMTNNKKSLSAKQFYFSISCLDAKYCLNQCTGWKVENV